MYELTHVLHIFKLNSTIFLMVRILMYIYFKEFFLGQPFNLYFRISVSALEINLHIPAKFVEIIQLNVYGGAFSLLKGLNHARSSLCFLNSISIQDGLSLSFERQTDMGQIDRQVNSQIDGWIDRHLDEQIDGRIDRWMYE